MPKAKPISTPWNKGKAVGQKTPFTPEQVHIIRHLLHAEGRLRDLALLNTAIDTLLRASDLLALKVEDVTDHHGAVVEECTVRQHKTQAAQTVLLLEHSRQALERTGSSRAPNSPGTTCSPPRARRRPSAGCITAS